MAVTAKFKNESVAKIFGHLGVSPSVKQKFEAFSLTLVIEDSYLFVVPPLGSEYGVKINTTPHAIKDLKQGKLGALTSKYLNAAITNVVENLPDDISSWDGKLVFEEEPEDVTPKEVPEHKTHAHSEGVKTLSKSEQKSLSPTDLKLASSVYQPVHGTSSNSVYYVVGISDGINVAARWKGPTLSIRAEGPSFHSMQSHKWLDCGLDMKDSYASSHFSVGDDTTMATRTLGAVLMSLSTYFAFKSGFPEVTRVRV